MRLKALSNSLGLLNHYELILYKNLRWSSVPKSDYLKYSSIAFKGLSLIISSAEEQPESIYSTL
jgi:hypothetical protein